MIKLLDADNDHVVGEITEPQLEHLMEELVEESLDEYSWTLTPASLEALENSGVDPGLVAILRRALGNRTSMDMRYEPE